MNYSSTTTSIADDALISTTHHGRCGHAARQGAAVSANGLVRETSRRHTHRASSVLVLLEAAGSRLIFEVMSILSIARPISGYSSAGYRQPLSVVKIRCLPEARAGLAWWALTSMSLKIGFNTRELERHIVAIIGSSAFVSLPLEIYRSSGTHLRIISRWDHKRGCGCGRGAVSA